MKSILLGLACVGLMGCGTKIVTGESSMSGTDSPVSLGGVPNGSNSGELDRQIRGTCELIVQGQRDPRTCEDVTLFIRNPADGQERRAEMIGAKFKFTGLAKGSYRLDAASSKYDLETNVKNEVTPGQTLKIRILAKPRS